MTRIEFTVPGQPIAKGRPRIGRGFGGRPKAYTPETTVRYENLVAHACSEAMAGTNPFSGPVAVELTVEVGVPGSWSKRRTDAALSGSIGATKRPDLDNCAKAVLDGMNAIAYADDAQIVELTVTKRYSLSPRVVVRVSELELEVA